MTSSILRTTLFSYTKSRTRASRENTDACTINTLLTHCGAFMYFNKLSINRKFLNKYIFLLWITKIYLRIFLLCLISVPFLGNQQFGTGYQWLLLNCHPLTFRVLQTSNIFVSSFAIDIIHKSYNSPVPYPTMHHSEQKNVHIFVLNCALWDLGQVHDWICEIGLLNLSRLQWSNHAFVILVIIQWDMSTCRRLFA